MIPATESPRSWGVVIPALRVLVLARLAVHALFVPVFEGPDEPFHLARARLFSAAPLAVAMDGSIVDSEIVGAIRA